MADLHGKGSMSDRNLIVTIPDNGIQKDENGKAIAYYVDVQLDQSLKNADKVKSGETKGAQTNPHLVSTTFKTNKGHYMTNHRARYAASQIDAIKKAAGRKVGKGKNEVSYGITASLTPNAKGQVMINTSKPMGPTKNPRFGKNTLEQQNNVTKAAQEKSEADYQAKKTAEASKETTKEVAKTTELPKAETAPKAEAKAADGPAFEN